MLDGCSSWCEKGWDNRLADEVSSISKDLQARARSYFSCDIQVSGWSSIYQSKLIEDELVRAKDETVWQNREQLIDSSLTIYLKQWGYETIASRMGISLNEIKRFIIGDVTRTAAQYKVEARQVKSLDGIQLWCEAVPNPSWPIRISNYDGEDFVPGLLIT